MSHGKTGTAPCGHTGEHLIGQYVRCPRCDVSGRTPNDRDAGDEDDADVHYCPRCMSPETEPYAAPYFYTTAMWMHCLPCGHCWIIF